MKLLYCMIVFVGIYKIVITEDKINQSINQQSINKTWTVQYLTYFYIIDTHLKLKYQPFYFICLPDFCIFVIFSSIFLEINVNYFKIPFGSVLALLMQEWSLLSCPHPGLTSIRQNSTKTHLKKTFQRFFSTLDFRIIFRIKSKPYSSFSWKLKHRVLLDINLLTLCNHVLKMKLKYRENTYLLKSS